jgi:Fe-S-cluster containining protein
MTEDKTATINWQLPVDQFISELKGIMDTLMQNHCVALPIKANVEGIKYFLSVFKCQQCGRCCTKPSDSPKAGKYIAFLPQEFEYARKYISHRQVRKHFTHKPPVYRCSYPCPLHTDKGCSIYKHRPVVCAAYPLELHSMEKLMVNTECPAGYKAVLDIYEAAHKVRQELKKL